MLGFADEEKKLDLRGLFYIRKPPETWSPGGFLA